ncbi:DNA/RNA non-specific endonuclease [Clostridium tertium]|uniref:DNA/RNA non-specific endonuclease n=1 Tax=Clostridium tertium TaxID=1559 RepID=UPI00232C2511|nr:DNA/RNA non-specific endonuclease [Clostridium tertium]MDB1956009.1 DNA/RNA non-specific endonuclease [Clostridium tertium]MDB1960045.1 DNA/RNA non-specific endonuclease [Clostridium tertium]MDB1962081.1 DNA/RNA non-specific endonuclease [Clostridium tertium]MDB1967154.1 DNA/RNA non-specific endonuclease [Clostridium tertium]
MKKIISILHIIMGSVAVYLSVLFLAVAIDSPFLAVVGLVVAPASIIYFNKKFTIKAPKYYLTLFGIMLVTIVASAIIMPTDANTRNQQKIAIENKNEATEDEEDTKIEENSKDDEAKNSLNSDETKENSTDTKEDIFEGYRLIEVDGGNLSGYREPNVVVDIGFGDREYYAFTNEYGQLVKVIAKEIILQDDSTEPVNSNGRYYPDEAKVPGVESKNLDEGHVIADSLGGVSNAYNITPQNSTLNRHGDQAYMEKVIRDAGGCTDFVAIITYPDTTTQIPSHYSYTYTINGNVINDEFDNINPDEYNASLESNTSSNNSTSSSNDNGTTSNSSTSNNTAINESSNNTGSTSNSGIVYWTPKGGSYHTRKSCPTLSRSKTILEGTIQESGKSDPCDKCH